MGHPLLRAPLALAALACYGIGTLLLAFAPLDVALSDERERKRQTKRN